MEKYEEILAELEQMREGAVAQMRARLDAVAGRLKETAAQVQELVGRAEGDLRGVVPTDSAELLPLAGLSERLKELATPVAAVAVGLDVMRRLDAGRAQSEVLQELLRQIGQWSGPRAIVVLRDAVAQGWASAGFPQGDPARSWRGNVADSPAISSAAEGKAIVTCPSGDKVLGGWFGGSGQRLLLVPMSLRGKVVGLLLALEGEAGLETAIIQQLTYTVGLMLETLSGRTVVPTAALLDPEDMTSVPAPAPVAAPAPDLFELEAEPAEPAPAPMPPPALRPMPPEIAQPVTDASATVHLKVPLAPTPPPPSAAAPAPAAPPPPPTRSPEEERKHEEAKRFARLLVSEIRLYNEQAVQAGKIARDIYHRLKDDIDRSREMYDQRVSADVRAHSNYFRDELVRILADGEPDALGM